MPLTTIALSGPILMLSLWQNGTLWYGQGNLLGQERLIEVDYFEAGLSELLDQQNP